MTLADSATPLKQASPAQAVQWSKAQGVWLVAMMRKMLMIRNTMLQKQADFVPPSP